jgi:hypothetical protein
MREYFYIPFKGDRNYVHGTDIFNSLRKHLKEKLISGNVFLKSIKFNKFSYKNLQLVYLENLDDFDKVVEGVFYVNGDLMDFCLIEAEGSPRERTGYDEDSIVSSAVFNRDGVELSAMNNFSTIEVLIALTKALNNRINPAKEGKWMFGRLDLNMDLPLIKKTISIHIRKNIAGRFSINEIKIDDEVVGTVQFIVGKP